MKSSGFNSIRDFCLRYIREVYVMALHTQGKKLDDIDVLNLCKLGWKEIYFKRNFAKKIKQLLKENR